jgi:hypothetical protein
VAATTSPPDSLRSRPDKYSNHEGICIAFVFITERWPQKGATERGSPVGATNNQTENIQVRWQADAESGDLHRQATRANIAENHGNCCISNTSSNHRPKPP